MTVNQSWRKGPPPWPWPLIFIILAATSARAFTFMPRILIRRSFLLYFIHRLFLARIARPLFTLFHAPAVMRLQSSMLHPPLSCALSSCLPCPSSTLPPFFCRLFLAPFEFHLSGALASKSCLTSPPSPHSLRMPDARASPSFDTCPAVLVPSPLCVSSSRSSTLPSFCASLAPPFAYPGPHSTAIRDAAVSRRRAVPAASDGPSAAPRAVSHARRHRARRSHRFAPPLTTHPP